MKMSGVFEWRKLFQESWEDVDGDENTRSHRIDEILDELLDLLHTYRRLSIRATVVKLNLYKETVRQILHDDLGMKKIRQKWIHDCWLNKNSDSLIGIPKFIFNCQRTFLLTIITGDEIWLLAVSRNNICIKMVKILIHWRYMKYVMTALKAIRCQVLEKCFQQR